MFTPDRDPVFLIPGPLSTATATRAAMLRDVDPWTPEFGARTIHLLDRIKALIHADEEFVCLPVPGAGVNAVEAMCASLIPRDGKVLCLVNGHYSRQMRDTVQAMGRAFVEHAVDDGQVVGPQVLDDLLNRHPDVTHVTAIHCETVTGALAPLAELADVVARQGRRFLVDGISTFGGVEIDARKTRFDAITVTANKCFEGVPGLGFVICRKQALEAGQGNSHSFSLDLHRTWQVLNEVQSWRMTPPVQVILALEAALDGLQAEGGVAARAARYRANADLVRRRLTGAGFTPLAGDECASPIIQTFHCPRDPKFDLPDLIARMKARDYLFSRGRTAVAVTFRVACIGQIGPGVLNSFIDLFLAELASAGVTDLTPASLMQETANA